MVKGYLSVTEASAHSGISNKQITRLLRLGKLKGYKVATVWVVKVASLERYLANRPRPGPKPKKRA